MRYYLTSHKAKQLYNTLNKCSTNQTITHQANIFNRYYKEQHTHLLNNSIFHKRTNITILMFLYSKC